jgi:hypothetical protein
VKGGIKGALLKVEVTLTSSSQLLDDLIAIHRLLANQAKEQGFSTSL